MQKNQSLKIPQGAGVRGCWIGVILIPGKVAGRVLLLYNQAT